MKYRLSTVLLDFDGTLVESVGIKDAAFRKLFSDYPEHLEQIMAYHKAKNAVVRFEKFRHIVPNILKLPYDEKVEKKLSDRFSTLVLEKIIQTPFAPGAREFLEKYSDGLDLILLSVTPEAELSEILHRRKISSHFKRVYGATWKKTDAIADWINQNDTHPETCVFIGDTPEDMASSVRADIQFIGRDSGCEFDNTPEYLFADFRQIEYCLAKLYNIN